MKMIIVAVLVFVLVLGVSSASLADIKVKSVGPTGVVAEIIPEPGDRGIQNLYMGVVDNDGVLYLRDSADWHRYTGGPFPVAGQVNMSGSSVVTVTNFNVNIPSLAGFRMYVAHGISEWDALNTPGHMARIYTVPPSEVLPKAVWDGQINVRGSLYSATLYKIQSALGVRPSGIDKTLALLIRAPRPTGAVLVDVVGGRNGWVGQSFTAATGVRGTMDTQRYLNAGTNVVFAEYRGSAAPGDNTLFNPPLPSYGSIIPGYDTDVGPEWGHGEVEDVVAILNFVKNGGIGAIDASRFYLAGGSHGGYLVLAAAHRVNYITKVFSEHGPTNGAGMADWFRNTPASAYPGAPGNSPRSTLDAAAVGNNAAEGNIWPGDREAFLQRVFRSAGGESEFVNVNPGCSLFTDPPLSTNILIATNTDDFIVPSTQGRAYYRRWRASYAGILFVEHAGADIAVPFDPATTHGDALDVSIGDQFFDLGVIPAQYQGQVPARVIAKVVDSVSRNPVNGAVVQVVEQNVVCVPPEEVRGLTNAYGIVALASVPSGFIRATISAPGYLTVSYDFEIYRGVNDFTGTPVHLVPQ